MGEPTLSKIKSPLPGYQGDLYAVQFVNKISTKDSLLRRVVVLNMRFLGQGKTDGNLTRVIPLNKLRAIHYDAGLSRAAFVCDGSERDWVVAFTNDHRNTFKDPAKFLEAVSTLTAYYSPEGPVPVTRGRIPPHNTLNLQLKPERGMKTVKEMGAEWNKDKSKIPSPRQPRPQQQQQRAALPLPTAPYTPPPGAVLCDIHLNHPHEELGLQFDGTEIVGTVPNSAFARAGVPLGRLLAIDGQSVGGPEDIRAVVGKIRAAGRLSFRVAVMPAAGGAVGGDLEELVEHDAGDDPDGEFDEQHEDPEELPYPTVDPQEVPGATRALIVGMEYRNTPVAIDNVCARAHDLRQFLRERGFRNQRVYTDDGRTDPPTRRNIIKGMKWLVRNSKPSDSLLFVFVGHGVNIPDDATIAGEDHSSGAGGILPVDYRTAGLITEHEVFNILVEGLAHGARLFVVSDCAHGGCVMDLPFAIIAYHDHVTNTRKYRVKETSEPNMPVQVLMMGTVLDDTCSTGRDLGCSLVECFVDVVAFKGNPTLFELLDNAHDYLYDYLKGPCPAAVLCSTRRFDANNDCFCDRPPPPPPLPPRQVTSPHHTLSDEEEAVLVSSPPLHPTPSPPPPKQRMERPPTPPWLTGEGEMDLLHQPLPEREHPPGMHPVVDSAHRQRLITFYRYYNPTRLPYVTSMLIQYRGAEEQLFHLLTNKYGPEPHNMDNLPHGWTKVQSPKGEVFYRHEDGRRQWDRPHHTERGEIPGPPSPGRRPPSSIKPPSSSLQQVVI